MQKVVFFAKVNYYNILQSKYTSKHELPVAIHIGGYLGDMFHLSLAEYGDLKPADKEIHTMRSGGDLIIR